MMELILILRKNFIFLLLFLLVNTGCDKIQESEIPDIPFSLTINLTIHNEINVSGNSILVPGYGFGGVIVYCELPGIFYAYDAACTHEVNTTCLVENDGVLGTCSCCESQFILMGGGFPSKGPAVMALRQYKTILSNGLLRIYN